MNEELMREYLEYLELTGIRKRTRETYRYALLSRYFPWMEERGLRFDEVRVKEAQEYQGWVIEHGRRDGGKYSNGGVLNLVKAAVSFYGFLKHTRRVHTNPFADIVKIRDVRKIPENLLKEQEMQELLNELESFESEPTNKRRVRKYRVHVMAEVLYSTGMRVSELAGLRREDIDFENGTVILHETKDGKERKVFLNEYAEQVLLLYVKRIEPLIRYRWQVRDTLFGAGVGELIKVMNRELEEVCGKLKLKKITSHGFRHSFGYHFLRAGCSIRYIQELLGHSRLRSTEVYTRVEKEDLKRVLEKYHPRKWRQRP